MVPVVDLSADSAKKCFFVGTATQVRGTRRAMIGDRGKRRAMIGDRGMRRALIGDRG